MSAFGERTRATKYVLGRKKENVPTMFVVKQPEVNRPRAMSLEKQKKAGSVPRLERGEAN